MQANCKVCGKPLHNPISIARGMGPKCAGIPGGRKAIHSNQKQSQGHAYGFSTRPAATSDLISLTEHAERQLPDLFRRFPSDLVDLVLSAPSSGSIAARIKLHRKLKKPSLDIHPAMAIKQIRRMCIDFRLLFWPGLSTNMQPLACIPCGENDWKIGEDGRVCSKEELVSYLSRYGIISSQI